MDETQLIKQAQKNPEAFGAVYDAHYQKIFRYIYYRVGNKDVAEDLTAETFFQALKNIWRFRFIKRPFSAWLYRIAATQVAMYYREKKKYCALAMEECPELIHYADFCESEKNSFDIKEDFYFVSRILKKLKSEEKNILILRYFEDKSLNEISEIMKMKLNTVKSHLRRGLIHLRTQFHKNNTISYGKFSKQPVQRNRGALEERKAANI